MLRHRARIALVLFFCSAASFLVGGCGGGQGYSSAVVDTPAGVDVFDRPRGQAIQHLGMTTQFGSHRVLSVVKSRDNWLGVIAPELGNGQIGWIKRNQPSVRTVKVGHSIRVDLSERRVELRGGGGQSFTVSIGAFGSSTPVGRFAVTDIFTKGIDPIYGCCAVVFSAKQPNLPPDWLGSDLVGLHGWSGPIGRAESAGCLRAKNSDMKDLVSRIELGTPVFIRR